MVQKGFTWIAFSWQHGNCFPPVAKTSCQQCRAVVAPSNNLIVSIQTLQFSSNVMSLFQIHFEIREIKFTAKLGDRFSFPFSNVILTHVLHASRNAVSFITLATNRTAIYIFCARLEFLSAKFKFFRLKYDRNN